MKLFADFKPLVMKWAKFGDPQKYTFSKEDKVFVHKKKFLGMVITCKRKGKTVFSIPLCNDLQGASLDNIKGVEAQAYINCDCGNAPVLEGDETLFITRITKIY
jgi:hypothetical protein